ncbi:hypothetical protein Dsin_016368, partial [Dipteronia sinensis]
ENCRQHCNKIVNMAAANFGFGGIVLTEDNYEYWKECLRRYFIAQGLWDVVTGKEPKPEDETSEIYDAWMRKNAMALHTIQVSCGAETVLSLRGNDSAKIQWEFLEEERQLPHPKLDLSLVPDSEHELETSDISEFRPLCKALEEGDWKATSEFLDNNIDAVSARITLNGDTALHIAVTARQTKIVKKLVRLMAEEDLEVKNGMGYTAFSIAATNGFMTTVEDMLVKNRNLIFIKNNNGLLPIMVASLYSSKEIVRCLYKLTPIHMLSPENEDRIGATVLNCLITDEL